MEDRAFDAVVIGAGPAGCAAAYDLATCNKRVAILERRSFPRLKPCGGALTVKALHSLRFSIAPVVRNIATDFIAGRELAHQARFHCPHPIAAMTVREELDSFVLKKTIEAGVEFVKIDRIDRIEMSEHNVAVVADGSRIFARFLIGADGANSTVRRLVGVNGERRYGFAIEGLVLDSSAQEPSMTFDFGVVPRGYGWSFPRGDHYNVGIYTYDSRFRLFPDQLRSYVKETFSHASVINIAGAPIGMWGWDSKIPPPQRRVFLVGDAAGLCEPVLGEGIYYAIKSGQICAASILEELNGRNRADAEFHKRMRGMRSELRTACWLAIRFYRDLGIGCLALRSPVFRYALMRGYSRGLPLGDIPSWKFLFHSFRRPPHLHLRSGDYNKRKSLESR